MLTYLPVMKPPWPGCVIFLICSWIQFATVLLRILHLHSAGKLVCSFHFLLLLCFYPALVIGIINISFIMFSIVFLPFVICETVWEVLVLGLPSEFDRIKQWILFLGFCLWKNLILASVSLFIMSLFMLLSFKILKMKYHHWYLNVTIFHKDGMNYSFSWKTSDNLITLDLHSPVAVND